MKRYSLTERARTLNKILPLTMLDQLWSWMKPLLVKRLCQETRVVRKKGEETFKNNISVSYFSFQNVGEVKFSLYPLRIWVAEPESWTDKQVNFRKAYKCIQVLCDTENFIRVKTHRNSKTHVFTVDWAKKGNCRKITKLCGEAKGR